MAYVHTLSPMSSSLSLKTCLIWGKSWNLVHLNLVCCPNKSCQRLREHSFLCHTTLDILHNDSEVKINTNINFPTCVLGDPGSPIGHQHPSPWTGLWHQWTHPLPPCSNSARFYSVSFNFEQHQNTEVGGYSDTLGDWQKCTLTNCHYRIFHDIGVFYAINPCIIFLFRPCGSLYHASLTPNILINTVYPQFPFLNENNHILVFLTKPVQRGW